MQFPRSRAFLKTVLPKKARPLWWRVTGVPSVLRRKLKKFKRRPPVGWVRFGSLRRLEPVDRGFGWRWGKVIDRYYIEAFLNDFAADIRGRVLEVADNTYTVLFGGDKVTHSDVLYATHGNPKATIIANLTDAENIPSNSFDCIILTQTLQFIYGVQPAIRTLHRILKPGGVLLVTSHGISQISRFDMDSWGEYWRFTSLSLRRLFSEVFPENHIKIKVYGNVLTATAFLYGLNAGELRREELEYQDPDYELILCARITKPDDLSVPAVTTMAGILGETSGTK